MKLIDQIPNLREEVLVQLGFLHYGVLVAMAIMSVAYVAAEVSEKEKLYRLVLVLAVSLVFWVAKCDYMIHQLGAYIRLVQEQHAASAATAQGLPYWDSWRATLKARPIMMPIVDFGAGSAALYMTVQAGRQVWMSGGYGFVVGMAVLLLAGIAAAVGSVRFGGV